MTTRNILSMIMLSAMLGGCVKTTTIQVKDPGEKTLADLVKTDYTFSLFYKALRVAGLYERLQSDTLTVLLPDNQAFQQVGITDTAAFERMDPVYLKKWMSYHLVKGVAAFRDIPQSVDNIYQTIDGEKLYFSKPMDPSRVQQLGRFYMQVNGDSSLLGDLMASNGVAHIMRRPLKLPVTTVKEYLRADTSFSILVKAMDRFGVFGRFSQEGPNTVFAPDNNSFRNQGITEAVVDTLTVSRYSPTLFNCYLFAGSRIFCSDISNITAVGNGPAGNGETYSWVREGVLHLGRWNPTTIALYVPCPPNSTGDPVTGCYNMQNNGDIASVSDPNNIMLDGVVHRVGRLVVLPSEMLKK